MKYLHKHKRVLGLLAATAVVAVAVAVVMTPDNAYAGTNAAEFDEIWATVKGWAQGQLGRVICGAMMVVGLVQGISRQSLMTFATGMGGGLGLYHSPRIVENIMVATLPSSVGDQALAAVATLPPIADAATAVITAVPPAALNAAAAAITSLPY